MDLTTPTEVAILALWRTSPQGAVEFLCSRRHEKAIRGGLWEFPGGKVDSGELPLDAAVRELREETGLASNAFDMNSTQMLGVVEHTDHELQRERSVRLIVHMARATNACAPSPIGSAEIRWIPIAQMHEFAWPAANAKVIPLLRTALESARDDLAPRS